MKIKMGRTVTEGLYSGMIGSSANITEKGSLVESILLEIECNNDGLVEDFEFTLDEVKLIRETVELNIRSLTAFSVYLKGVTDNE